MEENRNDPKNLIDTTDNLEAIAVMRCMKNIFFIIVIVCLVLMQAIFWAVNRGCIKTDKQAKTTESVIIITETSSAGATEKAATGDTAEMEQAAKTVLADTNQQAQAQSKPTLKFCPIRNVVAKITSEQLSLAIRMVNFVLILSAILYCLT